MSTEKDFKMFEDAINKQFELNGYTDVTAETIRHSQQHEWCEHYTTTEEIETDFKNWFIKEYSKRFRVNKKYAEIVAGMFILGYGLKIKSKE